MKQKYESSTKDTVLNQNPLVRIFFRWKFKRIIKLASLRKEDFILDFGCGEGWLKKILPSYNVIGYDINPKQTEIKDYKKLKPNKIFAIDVFEHIPLKEIKKIIKDFKKMNPNLELITAIPTENLISRKMRKLLGKRERPIDHITPLEQIWPILKREFRLIKKVNFLSISWIARFKMEG